MLSRGEVAALEAVPSPRSVTAVADAAGYSTSHASSVVNDLEEKQLVTTEQDGRERRVSRLPTSVSDALDSLVTEAGHIDIPDLCTPAVQRVSWFLDRPRTPTDIAAHIAEDEETVDEIIDRLRRRCLLSVTDDGRYSLQPTVSRINEFSKATTRHVHAHRVREFAPGAHIVWASPDECLVAARDRADGAGYPVDEFVARDGWEVSGLARFRDHDLTFFIAGQPLMHYSELGRSLNPERLACHTVAAQRGHRRAKFALVLLAKTGFNADRLRRTGHYLGVPDAADAFASFVDSRGDVAVSWFPSWDGFVETAEQYGVSWS